MFSHSHLHTDTCSRITRSHTLMLTHSHSHIITNIFSHIHTHVHTHTCSYMVIQSTHSDGRVCPHSCSHVLMLAHSETSHPGRAPTGRGRGRHTRSSRRRCQRPRKVPERVTRSYPRKHSCAAHRRTGRTAWTQTPARPACVQVPVLPLTTRPWSPDEVAVIKHPSGDRPLLLPPGSARPARCSQTPLSSVRFDSRGLGSDLGRDCPGRSLPGPLSWLLPLPGTPFLAQRSPLQRPGAAKPRQPPCDPHLWPRRRLPGIHAVTCSPRPLVTHSFRRLHSLGPPSLRVPARRNQDLRPRGLTSTVDPIN